MGFLLGVLTATVVQVGAFGKVHALFVQNPVLVASTAGGVFLYDVNLQQLLDRRITPEPVSLAVAELGAQVVYFVMGQQLYRWVLQQPQPTPLTSLPVSPVSLGIGPRALWLEYADGRVERRNFSGFLLEERATVPPEVAWCGPRAEVSHQDPRVGFLMPFQRWFPDVGEVEFTSMVIAWGRVYVGTDGLGVWIYDVRMTVPVDSVNPGLWPGPVTGLSVTPNGTWWIATPYALNHWRDKFTQVIRAGARPDFPAAEVQTCLWTPEALWIGTSRGIYRYQQGQFSWPRLPAHMTWVNHLAWHEGTLWVATQRGAYRLNDAQVLTGVEVFRVLPTHRGLVALTQEGVVYLPADTLPPLRIVDPRGWLSPEVSDVGVAFRDTVWLAGTEGLVSWVPGDTVFRYLPLPFAPVGQPLRDLAVNARHILVASAVSVYDFERSRGHWRALGPNLPNLGAYERVSLNGDTLAIAGERGVVFVWP